MEETGPWTIRGRRWHPLTQTSWVTGFWKRLADSPAPWMLGSPWKPEFHEPWAPGGGGSAGRSQCRSWGALAGRERQRWAGRLGPGFGPERQDTGRGARSPLRRVTLEGAGEKRQAGVRESRLFCLRLACPLGLVPGPLGQFPPLRARHQGPLSPILEASVASFSSSLLSESPLLAQSSQDTVSTERGGEHGAHPANP